MANDQNANTKTKTEPKAPAYIAWHVKGKDEKTAFWTRVGAAWHHKDGEGLTVQLETVPVNGRIILRLPKPPKADEQAEAA